MYFFSDCVWLMNWKNIKDMDKILEYLWTFNPKSDLSDNLWLMLPLDFLVSTESMTIQILPWRIYFDPKSLYSVYTQHSSRHWTANWLKERIYTLILETELKKVTIDTSKKQGFLIWCCLVKTSWWLMVVKIYIFSSNFFSVCKRDVMNNI